MADNYTETSFLVPITSPEQRAYWERVDISDEVSNYQINLRTMSDFCVIHSDCADIEELATVVQDFLIEFNLDTIIEFEWADTCSKPRPGEFGGGACIVSKTGWEIMNTREMIDELKKRL